MQSKHRLSLVCAVAFLAFTAPARAGALFAPDANCNPTISPPASGGCLWYNFAAHTDNTITGGSSFTNYYIDSGNPAWTITTAGPVVLRVLDGGHQGDTFSVFDNLVLLGTTSPTPIDANHFCTNDQTGEGTNPAACWNDPLMSRGQFVLAAGNHSLTVTWDQRVPGGDSQLQWFELSQIAAVPEPAPMLLLAAGLIIVGLGRRARR